MENRKNKKMSGIKPNRTATNGRFVKHISRLLVLVMLLTSALAFSGCDMKYNYILGSDDDNAEYTSPMFLVATSMTNIFDKSDVTFNIAYSTHFATNKNPKLEYTKGDDKLYFALYVCPYESIDERQNYMANYAHGTEEEIENIEGYALVKSMDEQEALSDKYAVIDTPQFISRGLIYHHTENVTIPSDFLSSTDGAFMLKLVCFKYMNSANSYGAYFYNYIIFHYKELDENTIEIRFEPKGIFTDER